MSLAIQSFLGDETKMELVENQQETGIYQEKTEIFELSIRLFLLSFRASSIA
jgi:hypothetical protein